MAQRRRDPPRIRDSQEPGKRAWSDHPRTARLRCVSPRCAGPGPKCLIEGCPRAGGSEVWSRWPSRRNIGRPATMSIRASDIQAGPVVARSAISVEALPLHRKEGAARHDARYRDMGIGTWAQPPCGFAAPPAPPSYRTTGCLPAPQARRGDNGAPRKKVPRRGGACAQFAIRGRSTILG